MVEKKKKKKKKKGIVTGQNQPLRAVWCKTRLLNSGGQFDQTCNLIGGAIQAQVICACAYDYHRLRRWVSKGLQRCMCVCVYLYVCVWGGGGGRVHVPSVISTPYKPGLNTSN